ncbi:helix-turn-helix transcriptional regulator [Agrobacterium salinitolerans]|nr:helix-turn-helix transcriptional regulator [Agrobacterium salinitolerans]
MGLKLARTKELDAVIGQNIRSLRMRGGITQESLGVSLGITFQQIQKYEKGTNRVSAAALIHFQNALGCELRDFFDGIDIDGVKNSIPSMSDEAVKVSMVVNAMPPWKQSLVLALTREVDKIDRKDGSK